MPEPWDPVPGDPGELSSQNSDYWDDFQIEEENPLLDLLVESEKHRKVAADILWEEVENQNRLAEEKSIFDDAVDWNDVINPKLSGKDKALRRKKVLKKETNRRANKLARTNRKKNRKK